MEIFWRVLLSGLALATIALAQPTPAAGIPNMQQVAQDLGVKCDYCHTGQRFGQPPAAPAAAAGALPSKFEIARAMIAMTNDLNTRILAATGKTPATAAKVTCMTCHRGVTVPGELSDIIAHTALRDGPDAAIAQYRDLRSRYYGRGTYDFGEDTLLGSAEQLLRVKPQAAIPILELNVEFFPKSVQSYSRIAYAYTRSLDDASAMKALEKALEIEPDNGIIRGQLDQLKSYYERFLIQE